MVATNPDKILTCSARAPFISCFTCCRFVSQGIETVRRDNCELVRKMVATSRNNMRDHPC
jgi:DNA polymerase elongation subunit (family B)